jgi:hypothetical protein
MQAEDTSVQGEQYPEESELRQNIPSLKEEGIQLASYIIMFLTICLLAPHCQ